MYRRTYSAKFRYQGETALSYLEKRASKPQWQREQEIFKKVLGRFPKGTYILDAPIGTGRFMPYYLDGNHIVYGLDISWDMLTVASEMQEMRNNAAKLIHADTEYLPIRNEAVDYVVCARLMNWVPLSIFSEILSEFRRVVRRGIIIEVRIRRSMGLLELTQKLLSEIVLSPRATIRRIIRVVRSLVGVGLCAIRRVLTGQTISVKNSKAKESIDGYVVHSADDVARMFIEQGLIIEDVSVVDVRTVYRSGEIHPFLVYTLRRKD